jgi:hypothetical protein
MLFLTSAEFIFGRVRKIWKATVSFVLSVCASVRLSVRPSAWDKSVPVERIFMKTLMKFYISVFFEKSVEKIQVSLKSDK